MDSPSAVRRFLQWYQGEDDVDRPAVDSRLPPWLQERTPRLRDEGTLVALDEYDLKGRLTDGPPDVDGEWLSPEQHVDEVEQTWRDSTEGEGTEAFAWYVPFHYSTRRWGIYVDEVGLQLLGNLLYEWSQQLSTSSSGSRPSRSSWPPTAPLSVPVRGGGGQGEPSFDTRAEAFTLALEILLRHEWYHHQVELLAAHLEDAADKMYYERYHQEVYRDTFPEGTCIEESLANAYVYRSRAAVNRAPSGDVFRALFHKSTERQPAAYERYHQFVADDFHRGGQFLGHLIRTGDSPVSLRDVADRRRRVALGANLPFTTGVHRPRSHRPIPIYIVRPTYNLQTLSYFRAVQLETNYDVVRSDKWEEKYKKRNELQELVDNTEQKIERNVNHPGFHWRQCPQGYHYGRMNKQHRMIVDKDDSAERVELIDFGEHDLPKKEYNCY